MEIFILPCGNIHITRQYSLVSPKKKQKILKGMFPDTPEKMLGWYLWPSGDHVPGYNLTEEPVTYHYMKSYRIPLMEMDSVNMRGEGRKIPKRIHQYLFSEKTGTGYFSAASYESIKSCSEANPDFEHYVWTEKSIAAIKHDSKYHGKGIISLLSFSE